MSLVGHDKIFVFDTLQLHFVDYVSLDIADFHVFRDGDVMVLQRVQLIVYLTVLISELGVALDLHKAELHLLFFDDWKAHRQVWVKVVNNTLT